MLSNNQLETNFTLVADTKIWGRHSFKLTSSCVTWWVCESVSVSSGLQLVIWGEFCPGLFKVQIWTFHRYFPAPFSVFSLGISTRFGRYCFCFLTSKNSLRRAVFLNAPLLLSILSMGPLGWICGITEAQQKQHMYKRERRLRWKYKMFS